MRSLRLVAKTVRAAAIDSATRADMWALFSRYYADVSEAAFTNDLAAKRDVILLFDSGDGSVRGFSTLVLQTGESGGKPFTAIFTGDTIVDQDYWGQTALHRAFFWYLVGHKLRRPLQTVCWFLISKGYKTYLTLTRNFATFYPRHDRTTPTWHRAMLNELSTQKFGDDYEPSKGIVSFAQSHGRLKDDVAGVNLTDLAQPDIAFFVRKNPGYTHGDELCCLGVVDTSLARVFLGKIVRRLFVLPFGQRAVPNRRR